MQHILVLSFGFPQNLDLSLQLQIHSTWATAKPLRDHLFGALRETRITNTNGFRIGVVNSTWHLITNDKTVNWQTLYVLKPHFFTMSNFSTATPLVASSAVMEELLLPWCMLDPDTQNILIVSFKLHIHCTTVYTFTLFTHNLQILLV